MTDILHDLGFRYIQNAKGSHEKWRSETSGKILLVPRTLKSRHTANAILKSAGYKGKI
ncbi:type II toxin-antitoxin system HicA family toxin [Breoghania sp. L-A4]|nr:type II toxin-antitoxin system HicA family toxin [Breoghania sp. L-A4]